MEPAHNRVLNFGKYKGQTLAQIHEHDPQYLKYLLDKNEFLKMKAFRLRAQIEMVLNKK